MMNTSKQLYQLSKKITYHTVFYVMILEVFKLYSVWI